MRNIIIMLLVLSGCISAISFDVFSEKGVYNPGSKLVVYADIGNDGNSVLSAKIFSTLVTDERSDEAMLSHEVYMGPNTSKRLALYDFTVTDDFRPGEYTVTATMVSNKTAVGYAQDTFMINGTPRDMDVTLLSCADSACANQSSMFLVGQSAYLDSNSTQGAVRCSATIRTPGGSTTAISLPSSITLTEKGTYTVTSTCRKTGYHDATPSLMLGAMEAWPEVKTIQRCNENNVCDNDENHSICPQDCPGPEAAGAFPVEYIVAAAAVIVAAILVWKFVLGKKR